MIRAVFTLLLLLGTLQAETYKGCGSSADRAREELAKSIYTAVESNLERVDEVSDGDHTKELKATSKQTTKLKLIGAKILDGEGGEVCATITKSDLLSTYRSEKAKFDSFSTRKLPKDHGEAFQKLQSVISDAKGILSLATALGLSRDSGKVQKRIDSLQKKLEEFHPQSVKFNIAGEGIRIQIDGKPRKYGVNETIPLSAGEHQYKISSNRYCPKSGSFELVEMDELIIDSIDMEDYRFPNLTFTTADSGARLYVDGKLKKFGESFEIKKCSGEISYKATHHLSSGKPEKGRITLKPSLEFSKEIAFITKRDITALQNLTKSYKRGERLEILYSMSSPASEFTDKVNGESEEEEYLKSSHTLTINRLNQKKHFRYGYGFSLGLDDFDKPTNRNLEIYSQFAIQLASLGSNELPPYFGKSFTFIPYFGFQVGIGYHSYRDKNGEIEYKFPSEDDIKEGGDKTKWDWKRDSVVLKPIVGIDFILSKSFALKLFYEKNIFMDKSSYFGAGLTVDFN